MRFSHFEDIFSTFLSTFLWQSFFLNFNHFEIFILTLPWLKVTLDVASSHISFHSHSLTVPQDSFISFSLNFCKWKNLVLQPFSALFRHQSSVSFFFFLLFFLFLLISFDYLSNFSRHFHIFPLCIVFFWHTQVRTFSPRRGGALKKTLLWMLLVTNGRVRRYFIRLKLATTMSYVK